MMSASVIQAPPRLPNASTTSAIARGISPAPKPSAMVRTKGSVPGPFLVTM